MVDRKQIFVDNSYEYDYEYNEEKRLHILYYSNGNQWSSHIKGTIAFTIKDDGNQLIFKKRIKTIDYDDAQYMAILLRLIYTEKYEISTKVSF